MSAPVIPLNTLELDIYRLEIVFILQTIIRCYELQFNDHEYETSHRTYGQQQQQQQKIIYLVSLYQ